MHPRNSKTFLSVVSPWFFSFSTYFSWVFRLNFFKLLIICKLETHFSHTRLLKGSVLYSCTNYIFQASKRLKGWNTYHNGKVFLNQPYELVTFRVVVENIEHFIGNIVAKPTRFRFFGLRYNPVHRGHFQKKSYHHTGVCFKMCAHLRHDAIQSAMFAYPLPLIHTH